MGSYDIISVKVVEGKVLNSLWQSNMQIIETDKGVYIDNMPNRQFGAQERGAKPGFDWVSNVGKTVHNVKIFESRGFQWLNKQ
ncbi:hypothetical protein [Desulfofustis limnaeus]|uniref:Uncharacterized protein n=1 Tax=Desulfofustis limnaeus TaxID=2740163 RepID=A0ABN6M9X9_9BACT|nr:hypothetical protein [Desulfofustis limnaeus]BDD89185.1 hypothetical protein DPPLL_35500 [Desulfofustis limnaeus]